MGIVSSILCIILGVMCIFQGYATYNHAKKYNKELEELRSPMLNPHVYEIAKDLGMLKKENTWIWIVLGILWLAVGIVGLC